MRHIRVKHIRLFGWSLAAAVALAAVVTLWPWLQPRSLELIRKQKKLVVVSRISPTIYSEGSQGPSGYEYDMLRAFAEHLGVELEIKVVANVDEVLAAIKRGDGDLAAAGLTRTRLRERSLLFGPAYDTVQQQVVCQRSGPQPGSLAELVDFDLLVTASSSYAERLAELKESMPGLTWRTTTNLSTEQILAKVAGGEVACTVADSNILAINRRYYPELQALFPISEGQNLAWIVRSDVRGLLEELIIWYRNFEKTGQAARLHDTYYSSAEIFDYLDLTVFHRDIQNRLPKYAPLFEQAAKRHDIPFDLLAAQAYQESHWDPKAVSPTGVRGIMMLTGATSLELGVENRLDPGQSIEGGARYFQRILAQLPQSVAGEDRYKLGLAAYNMGIGHLHDARLLAQKMGKNPDGWDELKTVLPLLAHRKYYNTLKHGYARGREPVRYVERIILYRDIIHRTYEVSAAANSPGREYFASASPH